MFSILNICLHSVSFTHDHMTAQLAEPSHVQWKLVYQYSISDILSLAISLKSLTTLSSHKTTVHNILIYLNARAMRLCPVLSNI